MLENHTNVILQLSAGRDSAACLWLLKQHWDKLVVAWIDAGDSYPETLAYMEQIKELVPNFLHIKSSQASWVAQNGYPVDIMPISSTFAGVQVSGMRQFRMTGFLDCCAANLWKPMAKVVEDGKYTLVIRGQRKSDKMKAPVSSGYQENGVTYWFPIEDWSDEDVNNFLGDKIPDSYKRGLKSSLDCMSCTAYLEHNPGRVADLAKINPDKAKLIEEVHTSLYNELADYSNILRQNYV